MSDGPEAPNGWARYLRELTSRPGWSTARLARESGVHRSTIFRWMNGEVSNVETGSVHLIARAAGEDPSVALLAAGDVLADKPAVDEFAIEIAMIENSGLPRRTKDNMIRRAERLRDRQAAERREQIRTWIEIAGDAQPAT